MVKYYQSTVQIFLDLYEIMKIAIQLLWCIAVRNILLMVKQK